MVFVYLFTSRVLPHVCDIPIGPVSVVMFIVRVITHHAFVFLTAIAPVQAVAISVTNNATQHAVYGNICQKKENI